MRLALATPDWPSFSDGGIATLSEVLRSGLLGEGHEVEVWTRGGGARGSDEPGVRHLPGRNWGRNYGKHWAKGGADAIEAFAPEAIVSLSWEASLGLSAALTHASRPGSEIPLWTFAHGRDITGDPGPKKRVDRDGFLARAGHWFCLSPWMSNELRWRSPRSRVQVVPAAIKPRPDFLSSLPASTATTERSLRLLSLGRLIPRKGHIVLLQALKTLGEDIPPWKLDIVGRGPEEGAIRRCIEAFGLDDRVRLWGYQDQERLEEFFERADLFVQPNQDLGDGDSEGYGLVFLEAQARGIPVVGGRTGGVPSAIVEGKTGLLVAPEDSLPSLCRAIHSLATNVPLRVQMGTEGKLRVWAEAQPSHLASAVVSCLSEGEGASGFAPSLCDSPLPPWVLAVRAAMPSPRPQAWQSFQQAVGFASHQEEALPFVADAAIPSGGPSELQQWMGRPLPAALCPEVPDRWSRPPLAGIRFRRSLRRHRSPNAVLWSRDPRVAAAEALGWGAKERWRRVVLEWHVRPRPEVEPSHRRALSAPLIHVTVSPGGMDDLIACGVPKDRLVRLPNACGLDRRRAAVRAKHLRRGVLPVLALGLHRRDGISLALQTWSEALDLPPLWIGGLDVGEKCIASWKRRVAEDPRLKTRVRFLGPVWGEAREDLLDRVGLLLALYPRDEETERHLCPLQVVDAAGSGLPLVASDLESVRAALYGQPATLVPDDSPTSLAVSVRRGLGMDRNQRAAEVPRWEDRAQKLRTFVHELEQRGL